MSSLVNTLDIPYILVREYIPVYSLYRVLSSPFICSRCSWVNAICEAISSLLGHETHESIMQGEKAKRESSPRLKRKSPGLKNRTIQSRKQRKFGSLLVSTLLDVFFLSFSPLPLCCRITRARLRFSHYQSGQSAIRYNKSPLIMQCWMPFPAKLFCHKPSSGSLRVRVKNSRFIFPGLGTLQMN